MPTIAAHVLPCGFFSMIAKTLLQALDVAFRLAAVLFEGGLQRAVLRRLRHFRECAQDLLFGVIDVLERVMKQFVECLCFFRHCYLHCEFSGGQYCRPASPKGL